MSLQHLKQQAIWAHNWTSFSPEKRGEMLIQEAEQELEEDLAGIKKLCEEFGSPELYAGIAANYSSKYERYLVAWISAKSRCMSSMITGGSNFPVRRAEKANNSEHNRMVEFMEWRKRILAAIKKSFKKTLDPLEEMQKKLKEAQDTQEYMKKINSAHATFKRKGLQWLEAQDLTEGEKKIIMSYEPEYSWIKHPFAPYQLQNNGANIKRMEQRVKELSIKDEMKQEAPITKYSFQGGEMVVNYEVDRIQIFFEKKPSYQELAEWKAKGLNTFNWSPSQKAWQRKITSNAMRAVKELLPQLTKIEEI